jgi:AP-1-like factor
MDYYFDEHVAHGGRFSPGVGGGSYVGTGYSPMDCPEQQQAAISQQENGFDYGLTSPDSLRHTGNSSGNSNNGDDTEEKRKAQNRAAQRAFRERKEKRVKQLEDKLSVAQEERDRLSKENELLRQENMLISQSYQKPPAENAAPKVATFPRSGTVDDEAFCNELTEAHGGYKNRDLKYQVYVRPTDGETLLGAGAIWAKIMEFEDDDEDPIDVEDVIERLRDRAVCDGFGPVYRLTDIEQAIKQARKAAKQQL